MAYQSVERIFGALEAGHAARDADLILSCYAPGALIYDLAPPLQRRGLNKEETQAWLATWDGPVTVNNVEASLSEDGDFAWSTALNRMRGRKRDGEEVDLWFRSTMCFRKGAAGWAIVHEHTSVPFYMDGSARAATDLQPPPARREE
jgi:ketosteroid isomerase-like protein